MPCLQLSDSATIIPTQTGIILKSDLGAFEISGKDIKVFIDAMVPLLDGTRNSEAIADKLSEFKRSSVMAFLQLLMQKGLIDETSTDDAYYESVYSGQWHFFKQWTADPSHLMDILSQTRVLIVGLESWGVITAMELAASGVGQLEVWDEQAVNLNDLLSVRFWHKDYLGIQKTVALQQAAEDFVPHNAITGVTLSRNKTGDLLFPSEKHYDLILVSLNPDNLRDALAVSRFCQAHRIRALYSGIDGIDAVIGPIFIPGASACFNCYRLRSLANERDIRGNHALESTLLSGISPRRTRTYLAPMASITGNLAALEALKLVTGYVASNLVGRILVQNLLTLQVSQHSVLRLPWCEVCGGAADGSPHGGSGSVGVTDFKQSNGSDQITTFSDLGLCSTPEDLRVKLSNWVDHRTGIIKHLVLNTPDALQPELPFTATAIACHFTDGHPPPETDELSSGKGGTSVEALLGATGEAIERYSASRYCTENMPHCSADVLNGEKIEPFSLNLYLDKQYTQPGFPFVPYKTGNQLHWERGDWGDTGDPVWVPALMSYFNFNAPKTERFCQVTSNGLAAGPTLQEAARQALYELIERDAFMITWLTRCSCPRIRLNGNLPKVILEVVRLLRHEGAELRLYLVDLGTGIPTVLCIGFGDGIKWPGATVSLACHVDGQIALQKAILEQGHVGPYVRRLMLEHSHPIPPEIKAVRSLIDHALYYAPVERQSAFSFLDNGKCITTDELTSNAKLSLKDISHRMISIGIRPAIVDLTSPDLRNSPFRVVRALGEHAQQINFGYHLRRLSNPRLGKTSNLNPDPHPLA